MYLEAGLESMLTRSGTHEGTCGLCTRASKCGTWDAGTFGGKKPLHVYECRDSAQADAHEVYLRMN